MKRLILAGLALLLASGLAIAAEISDLNTTDASNTARFPENQAPSTVNDGARALEGILARWYSDTSCGTASTGSSNAYAFAAAQTISSYSDGLVICFDANFANTGPATLNVDSVGAAEIRKSNVGELISGDIEAGQKVLVVYDGTYFKMLSIPALVTPTTNSVTNNAMADNSVGVAELTGGADVGTQTIYVPAGAMTPTASAGASSGTLSVTGIFDLPTMDFDAASDDGVLFTVQMPISWNAGTITYQVNWSSSATDTDGVAWGLQGLCVTDSDDLDSIDSSMDPPTVVTDDAISSANDYYRTAESGTVTLGSSPAAGEMCIFHLIRDVSDANDDMAEDARLLGVSIFYTTDQHNDD